MKSLVLVLGLLLVVGCSKSNESASSPSPLPTAQAPDNKGNQIRQTKINFEKFGLIRELGETDNGALFGLLSESGKFEISKIVGPGFLKTYQVGILNESSVDMLFSKSSKPLTQDEKQDLLSKFKGATILYTEGYPGNLCNLDEIEHNIVITGKVESTDVEVTFQFLALPNVSGNCRFHWFGIVVKYIN